jgi:hypothetical protein
MRSLGLTDCGPGSGRGALWTVLLAVCGIAALVLVAGVAQPVPGRAPGERESADGLRAGQATAALLETAGLESPLTEHQAATRGALATGAGDVSALQLQRPVSPARGRTGFAPDTQSIQRAVRARQDAIVAALGQRIRWSALPSADGHAADRPTIVTQPLRGPPSHG